MVPGAGNQFVAEDFIYRAVQQTDGEEALKQSTTRRVESIASRSMGGVLDDLIDVRKTQAAPLYDEALSQTIQLRQLDELFSTRPTLKLSVSAAQKQLRDRGRPNSAEPDEVSMEVIDRAKKIVDSRITSLRRAKPNDPRIGDLVIAKNDLISVVDALNPTYAQARQIFAGTAEIEDAMDIGLRASKASGRTLPWRAFQREMNDLQSRGHLSELEFARVGFARGLLDEIDNAVDGRDVNKIIRNEDMREKIKILFADAPDEAEKFIQFIRDGRDSFDSLSFISPRHNSQTIGRAQGLADFQTEFEGPGTKAANAFEQGGLVGGTTNLLRRGVGAIARKRNDEVSKQVADALAEFLFTPNSVARAALLTPPPSIGRLPVAQSGVATIESTQQLPTGIASDETPEERMRRLRLANGTGMP